MTKRELIDQILNENQTAEPAFLAQFSDEQLHEYLTHLKWLKEPRLKGNPSRFDRYFRSRPVVASPPGRWRSVSDVPVASRVESLDLSSRPSPPAAAPPRQMAPAPPVPEITHSTLLPPVREVDFQTALPADTEALEAMQLSPQERTELTTPVDDGIDSDDPPTEQGGQFEPNPPAAPAPLAEAAPDDQTWLF